VVTDNAVMGESELVTQHKTSQQVSDEEARFAHARRIISAQRQEKRDNNVRDQTKDVDMASFIRKLPIGENAGELQRKLFSRFDVNGNGHLSLSEVELGLQMMMGASGETVVDALGPAIARAFHAARDCNPTGSSGDFVEFTEFRLLLVYLKRYSELLRLFDMVDTTDDRRICFPEFQEAMPQLQQWGVVVEDAAAEFAKMDADKSGNVLFDEFSG
jgi:Ca2+-binding EF-hand superfamily protein